MLEQWQYETLRARAAQEGRSLSDLLREIVTKALRPATRRRLSEVAGVGESVEAYGEDHDTHLYGGEKKKG